jgi:predicted nuclease with RNAse H fold
LPSMQGLTRRGMALAVRLRDLGVPVIESYPGAAQDIMGIPRKRSG